MFHAGIKHSALRYDHKVKLCEQCIGQGMMCTGTEIQKRFDDLFANFDVVKVS